MLKIISYIVYIIFLASFEVYSKANWEYTVVSAELKSSDKNFLEANLRSVRVSRGVYAVDGTANLKMDIDNTYEVSLDVLRSALGNNQYVLTPFRFPPTPAIEFLNTYYKNYIMNSVRNCSNLIYFEDKWDKPFPKGDYYSKQCLISNENLPSNMQEGFYKLLFKISKNNNVVAEGTAVIKIEAKV